MSGPAKRRFSGSPRKESHPLLVFSIIPTRDQGCGARSSDGGKRLDFFQIECEVEDHLKRLAAIVVLVVAVHVPFQLPAVTDDLLPALLESDLHVLARRRPHIGPKRCLPAIPFHGRNMLDPDSTSLRISDVLFSHGAGDLFCTTIYYGRALWFP